jgi:DNA polymerase
MLWRMMAAINVRQEEVYVTNAVKCSQQDELKPGSGAEHRCLPWLEQELRTIQPKVICAMGDVAANALLGRVKAEPLHRLRAKFYPCAWPDIMASVMPTYHPRLLLLQPWMKKAAWKDLQAVQKKLQDV